MKEELITNLFTPSENAEFSEGDALYRLTEEEMERLKVCFTEESQLPA